MYAAAFLALASTAIAAPLAPRAESTKATPEHWQVGYLENYQAYHIRYLALECYKQKNTTFFDDCCHPLLATQNLQDDRAPYCTPNATAISSVVASQSATATISAAAVSATADAADEDAESAYCDAVNSTSTDAASSTWSSVPTSSAVADANAQYAEASSTSKWVAPSTTSTSEAAAQTQESSSSSSPSGNVQTGGYATFFYQGGNAGACGTVHSDSDKVIAIDSNGWWSDYASNSNSQYCGKWINIKNTNNGKTVTAMVADVCPTCVSDNSLDLSVGAFTAIADEWEGSVPIEWSWA